MQELLKETEKLLEKWKHPEPYCPPSAPGGLLSRARALILWFVELTRPTSQDPSTRETCLPRISIVGHILALQVPRQSG